MDVAQHPDWQSREPFSAVLANDQAALGRLSEGDWAEIIFQTHTGMDQAAFVIVAEKPGVLFEAQPAQPRRCERMHSVEREHGLGIQRMFDPERAVLIEGGDAVFRRHEISARWVSGRMDKAQNRLLCWPFIP
jgi:hypothetical protein